MAFTPKSWQNSPSTATPINAAALVELEERLAAYLPESAVTVSALTTEPTVYVSLNGSDTNSGLAWGQAFRTVYKAIQHLTALSGGTGCIEVGVGTFVEKPLVRPSNCTIKGRGPFLTVIKLEAGGNANVIQDATWGEAGKITGPGLIADLEVNGNKKEQTITQAETVTTTNGVTLSTSVSVSLPVAHEPNRSLGTGEFPSTGQMWVGTRLCSYTGKTETEFTGVLAVYSNGTTASGMVVVPFASKGSGLALQSDRVTLRNVRCANCVRSGRIFQGSGTNTNAQFSYQNTVENAEDYENASYGFEVIAASDSHVTNWTGGSNEKGGIWAGGADWEWNHLHPIGNPSFSGANTPALIFIVAGKQQFTDFFADRGNYESIIIDGRSFNSNLLDIKIDGELYVPSASAPGAGVGLLFRGAGSFQSLQGLRCRLAVPGRVGYAYHNGPVSFLLGTQNLEAPSGGRVQVLSSRSFAPSSTIGGKITVSGSGTFAYTGEEHFQSGLKKAASVGATSLEVNVASGNTLSSLGLQSSGTLVVYPSSTVATKPLKITYTSINNSTNKIEGIPASGTGSIEEALAEGTSISQHYLTGVTEGTGTAVADGTEITQPSMAMSSLEGDIWVNSRENINVPPTIANITTGGGFAGTTFTTGGTWTTPVEGFYRLQLSGGGAGGGGGGAAASSGGTATQVGGGGGGAGQYLEEIVRLAAGVTLTAVIGTGGGGGGGGAASSNTEGHAGTGGSTGSNSTLSGTGVSLTAYGGAGGAGGGANSATTVGGGQYAARESGLTATTVNSPPGTGGPASSTFGYPGGFPVGSMGTGGGGGAKASATEGGKSGNALKAVSTFTGTKVGETAGAATANTGNGGNGGGGGAPGGEGGTGGTGGSGFATIVRVA